MTKLLAAPPQQIRRRRNTMRRFLLGMALGLTGISPALAAMEDYPAVQLRALDKSTARTTTFEVAVGSTIQYGSLYIKVQSCRKAEPIDKPESAAFLQVWELPPEQNDSRWVFSGWMFASSPALSAMDHPVYDVWVLSCTGKEEPVEEPTLPEETDEAAPVVHAETAPEEQTPDTPVDATATQGEEPLLD